MKPYTLNPKPREIRAHGAVRSGLTDMENPHAPRVFENGRRVNLLEVRFWISGFRSPLGFPLRLHIYIYIYIHIYIYMRFFRVVGFRALGFEVDGVWAIMGFRL